MNVKLLRKVAKHILAEPKRFFMDGVLFKAAPGQETHLDGVTHEMPPCGTAACIAGWACLLGKSGERISMNRAESLLGISTDQGTALFLVENWPYKLYDRWDKTKSLKMRAKIAAQRIEHFIKTGE